MGLTPTRPSPMPLGRVKSRVCLFKPCLWDRPCGSTDPGLEVPARDGDGWEYSGLHDKAENSNFGVQT